MKSFEQDDERVEARKEKNVRKKSKVRYKKDLVERYIIKM